MFDSYYTTERNTNKSVTITENRAPTDESVRLLKEMEQAARDKVVNAIRLENSPIDCVIHAQDDFIGYQREFIIFVKINGKRLEISRRFGFETEVKKIADGLLTTTAERIAAELLGPAFAKLPRQLLERT